MRSIFIVIFSIVCFSSLSAVDRKQVKKAFLEGKSFLEVARLFVSNTPNILEAGAHNGESTQQLLKNWPQATLYAFEPNPTAYEKLKLVASKYTNVFTYPFALYDSNGVVSFYVQTKYNNDGASSLLMANPSPAYKDLYEEKKITVTCTTLDSWAKKHNVQAIDFMWLDMEGVELQVLKAVEQILKTTKAIYTETNFQEFRLGMTQFKNLHDFLISKGFEVIYHESSNFQIQGDALFVRKELLN